MALLVCVASFVSACGDATAVTRPAARTAARDYVDQCVLWEPGCPDVPVSSGGGSGSGEAAPAETDNPNVNFWPTSVLIVYTSPYDHSTMVGWASYQYSGIGYATYSFSASSFSTSATETGGLRMSLGELVALTVTGSTSIDVSWVGSHSAGGS
jgi:hypothetical protein